MKKSNPKICSGGFVSKGSYISFTSAKLGLDSKDFVTQDQKFLRPEELEVLKGDSSKLREATGWKPKYNFYIMMDEMIEYWLEKYKLEKYKEQSYS